MALQYLWEISAEEVEARIEQQYIKSTFPLICILMAGFVLIRGIFRFEDYNVFQKCITTSGAQHALVVCIRIPSFREKYF